MNVRRFMVDTMEANCFLVWSSDSPESLLIDCGEFNQAIKDLLRERNLRLAAVFITHDHADHTAGLADAMAYSHPVVYANCSAPGGVPAKHVMHGDTIRVGNLAGKVLATPGHTPDGVSLMISSHVFTGDALFAGSVGGTHDSRNAEQQLDHIRRNIFTLPDDYLVHVGHGPSTTVAVERTYNPFFV